MPGWAPAEAAQESYVLFALLKVEGQGQEPSLERERRATQSGGTARPADR